MVILITYFLILLLFATILSPKEEKLKESTISKVEEKEVISPQITDEIVSIEDIPPLKEIAQLPPIEETSVAFEGVKEEEDFIQFEEIEPVEEEPEVPSNEEQITPIVNLEEEFSPIPQDDFFSDFDENAFVEEDDDDFWADFYVVGEEDTSLFAGGEYYVPFYVNDEYITDINVFFEEDELFIDLEELEVVIGTSLIPKVYEALFGAQEESIGLQTLIDLGIDGYYDYQKFELYLYFPSWMLPKRVLSINRTGLDRYSVYQMSGSINLERPWFSTRSNLSIYSSISWDTTKPFTINWPSLFTLQSQSSFTLFDVAFDFSFLVHPGRGYSSFSDTWSSNLDDYITFNGIQGFYDFTKQSLRLSFGNVNDYLGFSKDRIGFGLEKRYNYGDVKPKNHQFGYEVTIDEPSVIEVFINNKSVYRRELLAGIYQLKDFAFDQGANKGRIEITPLGNPDAKRDVLFDLNYDSRLMAKGDSLYTIGISSPVENLLAPSFRVTQSAGLTHEFTGSYAVSTNLTAFVLNLNLIYASNIGTLAGTVDMSLNSPLGFGYSLNTGYAFPNKSENPFIGNFSFSVSYSSRAFTQSISVSPTQTPSLGASLDGSFGFSGRITEFFRYSVSTSIGWLTNLSDISLRTSVNLGVSLIPNLAINGSLNISKPASSVASLTYQIGANYTFDKNLNISASSDLKTNTYISGSFKPFDSDNDNVRFNLSGIKFDDPLDHQGGLYYSHVGRAYGLSISQQYSNKFTSFSTALSLTTSIAYADGLFGISRSIGDNFLLVKPKGAMKNQKIAVTRTMTTDPEQLPSLFGTSIYTGLSSHSDNNLVVYGIGDALLSSSESFIFTLSPRPRQGYATRVSSELAFSVVGNILKSPNSAYERYSAELMKVELDEDGNEVLFIDETLYLFTDENGFYFISGLSPGEYQFSIFLPGSLEEDEPIDIRFTITPEEGEETSLVYVLETFIASDVKEILESEEFEILLGNTVEEPLLGDDGIYQINVIDKMDENAFWESYYPKRLVLESVTTEDLGTSDAIVQIVNQQRKDNTSALEVIIQENPLRLQNLMKLRQVISPFIEATKPQQFTPSGNILKPSI
ncbi:MAG: hypothetical protein EOM67_03400 [Spirochaetia bacterium]|nr:hypothetical protein [Spirochaetia bacterium]